MSRKNYLNTSSFWKGNQKKSFRITISAYATAECGQILSREGRFEIPSFIS